MKHLVRSVTVLVILGVPAAAQAQASGGVRVGVNLANLSTDPKPPAPLELETLTGLVVGAFMIVPVSDAFAFQPEVFFSRQGSEVTDSGMTVRTKLDYVQVPLLARVRTGARSPLAIVFGPSLGFRTGATLTGPGIPPEATTGFEDQFKGFDFGLAAGAVIDVGRLVFDARYTWGLTNILKDTIGGEPNTDKAKNRVLSLSAGIRF